MVEIHPPSVKNVNCVNLHFVATSESFVFFAGGRANQTLISETGPQKTIKIGIEIPVVKKNGQFVFGRNRRYDSPLRMKSFERVEIVGSEHARP